jgi:hypothetical protein
VDYGPLTDGAASVVVGGLTWWAVDGEYRATLRDCTGLDVLVRLVPSAAGWDASSPDLPSLRASGSLDVLSARLPGMLTSRRAWGAAEPSGFAAFAEDASEAARELRDQGAAAAPARGPERDADGRPLRPRVRRRVVGERDGVAERLRRDAWEGCERWAVWSPSDGVRAVGRGCHHKTCPVCVGGVRARAVRRLQGAAVADASGLGWHFVTVTSPERVRTLEAARAFVRAARDYLAGESIGGTCFVEAPLALDGGESDEPCVCVEAGDGFDGCYLCRGSLRLPAVNLHLHAVVVAPRRWCGGSKEHPTLASWLEAGRQGPAYDVRDAWEEGTYARAQRYAGIGRVRWDRCDDTLDGARRYASKAAKLYVGKGAKLDPRDVDQSPWAVCEDAWKAGVTRAAGVAAAWQGRARWSSSWGAVEWLGEVRSTSYAPAADPLGEAAPPRGVSVRYVGRREGPAALARQLDAAWAWDADRGLVARDASGLALVVLGVRGTLTADGRWRAVPAGDLPLAGRASWLAEHVGQVVRDGDSGREFVPLVPFAGGDAVTLADYWPDLRDVEGLLADWGISL